MRHTFGFASAAAILTLSASLLANGRYPAASQILVDPSDPKHIVVSATFGFLDSRDEGRSFNWLCEAAIGPSAEEGFDIVLVVTGSGQTVLGLFNGMATTRDACEFQIAPGINHTVGDLTWRPISPHQVMGFTVATVLGGFASQIVRSVDEGRTWSDVGPPLPTARLPLTIDLAPSDPQRIYLSVVADKSKDFNSILMRSDDDGASFQSVDIPGTELHRQAYIAAVHPTEADRVYLRVLDDKDGVPITLIYMTADGGRTFQKIFTGVDQLFGFAISPDGTEMAFGGPGDGLVVGSADGSNLSRRLDVQPTALTWTRSGLYATADARLSGFSIGRSRDSGATFEGLYKYQSMCGETACGARATSVCRTQWDLVEPQLGASCTGTDGGAFDGSTDVKSDVGSPSPPNGSGARPTSDTEGSCAVSRTPGAPNVGAAWLIAIGTALRSRRRAAEKRAHRYTPAQHVLVRRQRLFFR